MDLKVMPRSHKVHKFILCIIDEVANYLITVPIYQAKSEERGEALIENMITEYCILAYIIMDQHSAFISSLMAYLLNKFNIKIRSDVAKIFTLGYVYINMFDTPNLGNHSPYELTYSRKPRPLLNLDSNPDIRISGTFKEYYEPLNKRLTYLQDILLNFR